MPTNSIIDQQLSNLPGLKWLPWIGDHYFDLDEHLRIFIVGESHYDNDLTEASAVKVNLETFTRVVIDEVAYKNQRYKVFSNFHRVLFETDRFHRISFWNKIAFFNMITKPMNTKKGRPSNKDFYNGWKTFFEVIKILKPQICIFIGTTAANSFTNALQNTGFSSDGIKKEDKIDNAYAKTAVIRDEKDNQTKIIFIRHTSRCSWPKWHNYLKKTIPSELMWLEKQIMI